MAQKFVCMRRAEDHSLAVPGAEYTACSDWGSSSPITDVKCRLSDLEVEETAPDDWSLPSPSEAGTSNTLWGGLDSSPLPPLPFNEGEVLEQMADYADWLELKSDTGPLYPQSTSSSSSSSSSKSLSSSSSSSSSSLDLPQISRRGFCQKWIEENEREHELCTKALRRGLEKKGTRLERKIEKMNGKLKGCVERYERVLEQLKTLNE